MQKITLGKATGSLADYVQQLGKQALVVTAQGKPVAALVPIEDMDLETLSLSTNSEFLALIERSRQRQHAKGGASSEEMRQRFGI